MAQPKANTPAPRPRAARAGAGAPAKAPTGIPGFDVLSFGGLPRGRATLVSGSSGSGKTIFCCQFLLEGVRQWGEHGVFVSFEEPVDDLRRNVRSFGWNLAALEKAGQWAFVDAAISFDSATKVMGEYDLHALLARIEAAVKAVKARRIVLDSIGSLFHYFDDPATIRRELYKILQVLKKRGLTVLLTSERLEEYGNVSRFGVEEYIADNVLILRNVLDNEKRRRTVELLKFRGSPHTTGEQPYVIDPKVGVHVIPLTRLEMTQKSSQRRVSSGNNALDAMCGGGFFKDSIVLVSGATGTGKTLMVTEFVKGGYEAGERVLFLAYEESHEQLLRNAKGWGVDFAKMEKSGKLRIESAYPETANLEEHLLHIERLIDEHKPARFALDSLSAIERGSSKKNFREFLIALTSFLKKKEVMAIFTSTSTNIVGGTSVTDAHISTITDTIILLRYAEVYGNIHRVITVLKMRGSLHTKSIFEFDIDGKGMHISGQEFNRASGILGGMPMLAEKGEGKE
ncbi:circadian clock protein KaiC [Flaviaesturariibacter aridisoli]|uniref:non-specific serine/threonine protein kinase n=1 Tax=Flaviaesturariibacter aridisoli TaxID=2545761 RepID=A0A4R4DX29_9BACT|nr:circadian clock protein KaiC [Flaviaesturariibacter aridisoli]TCZ67059.1 circadian clock protein KaiC [Flaviaesturariibacter aridisoli]